MNRKMKTFSLGFLATATIFAPLAAIVACDTPKDNKKDDGKTQTESSNFVPETPTVVDGIKVFKTNNVDQDGIYFKKSSFYNGKILNPTTKNEITAGDDDYIAMPTDGSMMAMSNVVELGDGDTFYMIFDNDDADGLTANNFENEFNYIDTSYSSNSNIDEWNTSIGNKLVPSAWGKSLYVGFKDGKSLPWGGSQSNHTAMTFDEAMQKIQQQVQPSVYQGLENYYSHASHAFVPVFQPGGLFTYTKPKPNVYAITFHNIGEGNTAGEIKLTKSDNTKITYDTWSIGGKAEWQAYDKTPTATFFAKKI